LHPGNLPLPRVHPTGVFPSLAFAMLQQALDFLSKSQAWQRGDGITIVDPMCGAGTIPLMAWTARVYLSGIVAALPGDLLVRGIDTDEGFIGMANENAAVLGAGDGITFETGDFSKAELDPPADVVVCQPPYGYSIAVPETTLASLHARLFEWAARNTRPGGMLVVISPRDDIISEAMNPESWQLVRSTRVRQHSIECRIYSFSRLDEHL
jgi:23S rRNA G2445 N2-methylase RlmL